MLNRYTRDEMRKVWSEDNKFYLWLIVEIAILQSRHELGELIFPVPESIERFVKIDSEEINRIEAEVTKHDVIAFLEHVSPQIPEELRPWLHRGITSYDIGDTALALQMRDSLAIIMNGLKNLMSVIKKRAFEHKYTIQVGRTHGIHAEPITFGVKLANWYAELDRQVVRLKQAYGEVLVGKISGAVGMYTIDPRIEELVCSKLGLKPIVATQIISRDIVALYMSTLANLAATIGKVATNLRLLSQTEIGEVMEPFGKTQKGSSAMPHKKNPIGSENINGLMRVVCSNVQVAYDNLATCWNERSLDNSGSERVVVADSAILVDYALTRLAGIIEKMSVFPEKMMRNIRLTNKLIFSQEVMMFILNKSELPREEVHTLVSEIALKCWGTGEDFLKALTRNEKISSIASEDDLLPCFNLEAKIVHVDYIFERVFGEVVQMP